MATTAESIIGVNSWVVTQLNDFKQTRYLPAILLQYLNLAQQQIVLLKPDAKTVTEPVQLVAGTKQSLAATRLRLIKITRNMGVAGLTPGSAITLMDLLALDQAEPDWHIATAKTVVRHYAFDDRVPKQFWVYPPVHAVTAVFVEQCASSVPTPCANLAAMIDLDDIYALALGKCVLWQAFSADTSSPGSLQRAMANGQQFFQLLGLKVPADFWTNPRFSSKPVPMGQSGGVE
jgi:hypothetical protein